jgi:thioesterase-3
MEATLTIIARSTEIDGNGHVNNARYLEYMEWGRQEWNKLVKLNPQSLDSLGIQLVTVNVNINYRKEVYEGDELRIITRLEKLGRTSLGVYQTIYNQHDQEVVNATTTRVAIDKKERKSTPVPDEIRVCFEN